LVGSSYINTEDNYERLIEFLSRISKLSQQVSYLILWSITSSPFRFLC